MLFVEKARRVRYILGGRMCQDGIIVNSGILALNFMMDHLAIEDHVNAKRFVQGLS